MSQTTTQTAKNAVQMQVCPVCKSDIGHWAVKKNGDDTYTIDRCSACGYAFVNPRPSMDFLRQHYSHFGHGASTNPPTLESVMAAENANPNSTLDAKRMFATIKGLLRVRDGVSANLLDVGAGYGFFSKEAVANGFKVVALDLAENERSISRSISGIDPISSTFEDFELEYSSLSVVLMSQILEHALDVEEWVRKASKLLEKDGILAIALPNFGSLQRHLLQENEPYICPPDHLNFFTPESLTLLLKNNGFVVEKIQHVSRIPKNTIQRRVPAIFSLLSIPLWSAVNVMVRLIDSAHFGSVINVYARKATD